jgi:putative ABC transport system ATP-binding protein
MEIIRCENLSKIYRSGTAAVHAVDGVSLSFERGSFTAVTGKSGSGKSTLLHLLSGLDRPTSGQVIYQEKNLFGYNDDQLSVLRRRRFGFVFQAYNLVRELTARENILLPVMLDNRRPDEDYLKRLVDVLGIEDRLNHLPGALSGGQQQRVCIARALANKPAILFADEPTGNLDGKTGREVLTLMRTVSDELGITMILVTHDLGVAEQADRVIRLEDGTVAEDSAAAGDGAVKP